MSPLATCRCLFRLMRHCFLGRWIFLLVSERFRLVCWRHKCTALATTLDNSMIPERRRNEDDKKSFKYALCHPRWGKAKKISLSEYIISQPVVYLCSLGFSLSLSLSLSLSFSLSPHQPFWLFRYKQEEMNYMYCYLISFRNTTKAIWGLNVRTSKNQYITSLNFLFIV